MSVSIAPRGFIIGGISIHIRDQVHPEDPVSVRRITESSGFFSVSEIDVAVELVQTRLLQGVRSGYHFLFADGGSPIGATIGYSCFGPIPCTQASFDLYWIAVHDSFRRIGLGKLLLAESEATIRQMGGKRVYVETSSRSQYEPTRVFYSRTGYVQQALIPDFYAAGDGKIIYVKELK
ncbi:MAG: GNAT family N-acetyltransferase [Spirochaetales bacterium]|nr:GNAT family N-acetyltransferase [Spirochaetales bacterium]